MNPVIEILDVTPALALEWLASNENNRRLRPPIVAKYARDMANGDWAMTGEAIKLDFAGNLIDGQHRLNAVVRSGATIPMVVVKNLHPESQSVMDAGAKRSQADALVLDGVPNAQLMVGIARLCLKVPALGYSPKSEIDPSNAQVHRFVREHESALMRATEQASSYRKKIDLLPSTIGATLMRLSEVDVFETATFFDSLADMRTEGPGDPRYALLSRLRKMKNNRIAKNSVYEVSLVLRVWNKWRAGESALTLPTAALPPKKIL